MKGKKTDLTDANCGIARTLQIIGDWWTLLIVRDAFHGRQRFGEFQKSLGLAKNILSSRLKKLVEDGIFALEPGSGSASSHRYVLTPKGEQLCTVLVALWQWGEENCFEPGELTYAMVDKPDRQPLARLQLKAQDGRVLGPRDFRMVAKEATTS
ncbi:transcriptional regulator, HxlR family [Rhizobium sp. CF080]|uniref:winged helix-turn-helix transcriptional regulator n=1 Tax=Rhizobium sp. (strain CF080) TaxID=1144310 RepID=UPI0002718975|nr:helix-turn-helix domain-containing protein [Rhizobium sp. CF080]EUB95225.1 transcriptional regulator, HxlR family [Rhizobium sp. CF080]